MKLHKILWRLYGLAVMFACCWFTVTAIFGQVITNEPVTFDFNAVGEMWIEVGMILAGLIAVSPMFRKLYAGERYELYE